MHGGESLAFIQIPVLLLSDQRNLGKSFSFLYEME